MNLARLLRSKKAMFGLAILAFFALVAAFGPFFVGDASDFLALPLLPPSRTFLFGTTRQGQDVFAQTIVGARTSLAIGFSVGLAVTLLGVTIGLAAGFLGGVVDDLLSLLINVFLIIPGLPLAVLLAAYLEAGPLSISFVLIITGWAWNARIVRAQTLSFRKKDFVLAAIVGGEHPLRIMFCELLPNMASLIVTGFIGATVYAIGAQVGLEFLGLGDVSQVTWGTNLFWAATNQDMLTESWWTMIPTGVCIALVGFSLVLVNFALDEVTSPRLRAQSAFLQTLAAAGLKPGFSTPVIRSVESQQRLVGER
jgi:peptide/nickel transport system permease protein